MNAGIIVGYVTQPNGSPVSGAEIWISRSSGFGGETASKPVARTDARGYFQLNFNGTIGEIVEIGGNLNVSVGAEKIGRANYESCAAAAAENRLRVTGYLINQTASPDV